MIIDDPTQILHDLLKVTDDALEKGYYDTDPVLKRKAQMALSAWQANIKRKISQPVLEDKRPLDNINKQIMRQFN